MVLWIAGDVLSVDTPYVIIFVKLVKTRESHPPWISQKKQYKIKVELWKMSSLKWFASQSKLTWTFYFRRYAPMKLLYKVDFCILISMTMYVCKFKLFLWWLNYWKFNAHDCLIILINRNNAYMYSTCWIWGYS